MQFDFPDENGNPYRSSGGEIVWNEKLKREIPKGWEYRMLSEIEPNIVTGKTPSTSDEENFNGSIPFITIDDIRRFLFVYNTERTLSEKGAATQRNKFIPRGSLCCSCIGTTGVIGFVGRQSQTNQQINSIVFQNEIHKEFLKFSLEQYFSFGKAKIGNILPNMNKEEFSSIPILYANLGLITKYHRITSSLFKTIDNNICQLNQLIKLRDELIRLLMKGQASVNYDL